MLDNRLVIELFTTEPDLVTPTGIAIDSKGRVLVVECHTHFPPEGYAGPKADRIRAFEDTDGNGLADRITTFFEGTRATMNLAIYHDGSVFVATRNEIFRLRDIDGDGHADQRTPIARLETAGDYPHNGLSGFAFDFAGNVYFGMGENSGTDYKLVGSDGTALAGGGEGGNIYRCGADGEKLVRIATGFWNPFHLCLDSFGRLFAVDNDPDSRPPCRLLHIVPEGDYGYRYRNGRKGLHPFTAWNGELPGTLPMVAGTGEAPSGIVAYESGGLPDDYLGDLLVTSWGDHRLDRFKLVPRGASFTSTAKPFVTGGENFRPVGIAVAPDGSLYVSDWVDKSYTLHGQGRIWRVRSKQPVDLSETTDPATEMKSPFRDRREQAARELLAGGDAGLETLRQLRTHNDLRTQALVLEALGSAGETKGLARGWDGKLTGALERSENVAALAVRYAELDELDLQRLAERGQAPLIRAAVLRRFNGQFALTSIVDAFADPDPFVRQAALVGMKQSAGVHIFLGLAQDGEPAVQMAGLLLLRDSNDPRALVEIPSLLQSVDHTILFAVVQWVGEHALNEYRSNVEEVLARASTRQLFEGCLAALELLDRASRHDPRPPPSDELAGEEYVARVLTDSKTTPYIRRYALRMLRPDHPLLTYQRLQELFAMGDMALRLEVVRTVRESRLIERTPWLSALVADAEQSTELRAEAIVGLVTDEVPIVDQLLELASGDDDTLRAESLRSLRNARLSEEQRRKLEQSKKLQSLAARDEDLGNLVARVLRRPSATPALVSNNIQGWLTLADKGGDSTAGERIFFHPRAAGCYRCHQVDGRGGRIGPELSTTARQLDRVKLVEAIVEPSKEIAPRFVPWSIVTTEGKTLTGLLVSEAVNGEQSYADAEGRLFVLRPEQIEQRVAHDKSIMPDNLIEQLTAREFRDLLAFLQGR